MGILQDHQYASFNKIKENKNKNVKIWEKEETDEERLQVKKYMKPLCCSFLHFNVGSFLSTFRFFINYSHLE